LKKLQQDLQKKKLRLKKKLREKQLFKLNKRLYKEKKKVLRKRNEVDLNQDMIRLGRLKTCINLYKTE